MIKSIFTYLEMHNFYSLRAVFLETFITQYHIKFDKTVKTYGRFRRSVCLPYENVEMFQSVIIIYYNRK